MVAWRSRGVLEADKYLLEIVDEDTDLEITIGQEDHFYGSVIQGVAMD